MTRVADVDGLFTTEYPVWDGRSALTISGPREDGKHGYRFHNTMNNPGWALKKDLGFGEVKTAVESHDAQREEFEMFKVGDRVRITQENFMGVGWVGITGTIDQNKTRAHIVPDTDRPDGLQRTPFYWDDVERILETEPWVKVEDAKAGAYSDDEINAALGVVKEERGLCGEFDDAVARARKPIPFLNRLDEVAGSMNRSDVFRALLSQLEVARNPRPALPNVGDYIRVTHEDGATTPHEGTVVEVEPYETRGAVATVYFDAEKRYPLFVIDQVKEQKYGVFASDVTWEPAEKPEKEWAFGDIVTSGDQPSGSFRAVDKDGALWFDDRGMYTQYAPYKLVWLEDKEI